MTKQPFVAALVLISAFAPALAHAQSSTLIQRANTVQPTTLGLSALPRGGNRTAGTAAEASAWADIVCGGDSFIIFDMDVNGDPVDGTIEIECLEEDYPTP